MATPSTGSQGKKDDKRNLEGDASYKGSGKDLGSKESGSQGSSGNVGGNIGGAGKSGQGSMTGSGQSTTGQNVKGSNPQNQGNQFREGGSNPQNQGNQFRSGSGTTSYGDAKTQNQGNMGNTNPSGISGGSGTQGSGQFRQGGNPSSSTSRSTTGIGNESKQSWGGQEADADVEDTEEDIDEPVSGSGTSGKNLKKTPKDDDQ